jgi:hypothetical protein
MPRSSTTVTSTDGGVRRRGRNAECIASGAATATALYARGGRPGYVMLECLGSARRGILLATASLSGNGVKQTDALPCHRLAAAPRPRQRSTRWSWPRTASSVRWPRRCGRMGACFAVLDAVGRRRPRCSVSRHSPHRRITRARRSRSRRSSHGRLALSAPSALSPLVSSRHTGGSSRPLDGLAHSWRTLAT